MDWLNIVFVLVTITLVIKANHSNGTNEDSEILPASLPEFSWIDQVKIQVKFPDGTQDRIVLWPPKGIAGMDIDCLYDGILEGEASGDVVVSGCKDDGLVSITIHSNRLMGRTMFNVRDNATEKIPSPYANADLLSEVYDYEDEAINRTKRSIFEDYVLEDYDEDYSFDGIIPPRLKLDIKLGFEESLKNHLGGETAAREYVVKVFTHSRSYMKHTSLGTMLDLALVEPPIYVPNKHWKARRSSLAEAKTVKTNETVPAIYFCFDGDDDNFMGVSRIRGACDPIEGVGIVKFRENVQVAANTLNHEQGHLVGLKHDREEDRKKENGNKNDPCHGNGFMSEMAPAERPTQFSVCSEERFKLWYHNFGTCLTEVKIPENVKKCPFLPPSSRSSILPCQCKADSQHHVFLFCERFNDDTLDNLAKSFECRNKVHKLEINLHEDELNNIGSMENIGKLAIEYLHFYNISKITSDLEANVFKGSSQTLKEIKIQRLPGMDRGGGTIKTEALSNLVALTKVHLGEDFQTIQSKAFSGLPSLVNIKMEGVKTIETNAFYDMAALHKLDLANNEITDLGSNFVNKAPTLAIIDLSFNSLSSLPNKAFDNLPALAKVYLNDNKIISIYTNAMANLPKLQFLDISKNEIQEVGKFLNSIKNRDLVINLKETKIQLLMEEAFKPFLDNIVNDRGTGYVNLENVQLDCGCDIKWLFSQPQDSGLTKFKNAVCEDGITLEKVDSGILDGLCPSECIRSIEPEYEYFGACVGNWCRQKGPTDQFTRCESVRDDGLTCVNPEIKYGTTKGGIPSKHNSNNYDEWCQQLFGFGKNSKVTFGSRNCAAPRGRLFWYSGFDDPGVKWCDWDGKWKDQGGLHYHDGCGTDGITSVTCSK